uniref:Gamma-tubulin complex component 6 n=1 Tax=Cyprinus carpio TaxID=7962 RepID=A0A8C2BER6_CYPCA
MRNILSTQTPSPLLPLPLDCQSQLVKDVLNVLIGVSSVTFPLNETSVQFDVRPDICVSGTSPESVSRLLGELAQYGTHYLRLSRFSLSSTSQKGLVFQAFTGGLRRYLHYYRACVLSTPASLSLLTIACHFRKLGRQLRYLSELCCVDGIGGVGRAAFPVKCCWQVCVAGLRWCLCYWQCNVSQSNCSNENHPVLLSLLKSSCEPYTRFVSDWVYSGVFRDVYKEFMIEVNEDYLTYRDKNFWTQGYTLISCDAEDCVPVFLKHIANDVYVCGKTINLLKICCPQHYIFWSDVPVPRIAVTFSLQEVEEIERDCAVYRGRMETIARHSAISREEKAMRTEQARQELINLVRVSAAKTLERIRGHQVSQRLAEEAQKRERFEELKQQLELDQEWRSAVRRKQQEDDFSYARELRDREQRLQALEEQLERRARMDLITQYSQLSEAAARRELRAMWKVQRMKLDERRVNFLQQEQQNVQAILEKFPLGQEGPPLEISQMLQPAQLHLSEQQNLREQQIADPPLTESFAPLCSPAIGETQALKSEEIDIADFLPKPLYVPDSGAMTQALHNIGSDLLQSPQKPHPQQPHPSTSHICVGENVSEFLDSVPVPNIYARASKSSFLWGQFTPEVPAGQPKASVHGHPSQSSVQLGGSTASGRNKGPIRSESNTPAQTIQERTCEAESNSQCTEKQPTVDETGTEPSAASTGSEPKQAAQEPTEEAKSCELVSQPSHCSQPDQEQSVSLLRGFHESESDSDMRNNSHDPDPALISSLSSSDVCGHSSNAHIKVYKKVSEQVTPLAISNIHGHASDAHIRVGEHVSEVTTPLPTPNIHGHASDAHIRVGDHVSEVTTPLPTPNIHGHASDAHIRVGEHGAEEATPIPTPNITGHASDAHLRVAAPPSELFSLDEGLSAWALGLGLSPKESPEDRYLLSLALQYQVEQYQDSYGLMTASPDSELLLQVTRGPNGLPVDPSLHRSTDATAVQLNEMMPLPVLMKHSVTTPLITQYAVVDYFFVELGVEKHFETLRHFLLMEDGEFALSLSDQLFEKLGSGQTPGELLTPLVLNSILNKALQYSVHGDSELAAHFTFALRYLPEIFHPHAPDSLNCLELRYKVDWPVNIVITDSCLNKYNRLFSFLLQLKHMVWSLRDVWFHLKRTALVKGAGRSAQFHQLQLYRHEMQHFVKVIQGYIANQILQVSWSEFTHKLSSANDLDAIHRTHAEYLNRAIFRGLLTEKAAPVMNIIHSIFSLILKFRGQLIAQPWELQQGEPVHPSFIAMQQSYNTFKYYSRFLFKVVTKLVDKGYQPHLEDFLLRINLNNYYKDS